MFTVTNYTGFSAVAATGGVPNTPNLAHWYDFSDVATLTTSGTQITQITDKSGNNRTGTKFGTAPGPNYVASAQNGLSAADFPWVAAGAYETHYMLRAVSTAFPAGHTKLSAICVVAGTDTTHGAGAAYSLCQTNVSELARGHMAPFSAGTFVQEATWFDSTDQILTTAAAANTSFNILYQGGTQGTQTSRYNGGTATGTATGTKDWPTGGLPVLVLGYRGTSDGNDPLGGRLGEIRIFNGVLGTDDIFREEGYLAWKWGIQAKLPSNHPYKNAPP